MNAEPLPWAGITEGRIVHVRHPASGRCQAAIVVRLWEGNTVNLQVFRDGSNDAGDGLPAPDASPLRWATSVRHESNSAGSGWHFPERVS